MTNDLDIENKEPTVDPTELNAFIPSPFARNNYTSATCDIVDDTYHAPYTEGRWKILLICVDERYVLTKNGGLFSSGNHPVETLVPMHHLDKAGFTFDIATISGNPAKLEYWAMPSESNEINSIYSKYSEKFRKPLKLQDVVNHDLGQDSDYIAVFLPGGHSTLIGLPENADLYKLLAWTIEKEKLVISLCHGPAALLAGRLENSEKENIFKGYEICAFPDSIDAILPDIGYLPGHLTWKYGERLERDGIKIVNNDISGMTHQDRNLLTGDSPLASNALGRLAADALLQEVKIKRGV